MRSWGKTDLTTRTGNGGEPDEAAPAPGGTAAADPDQGGSSHGTVVNGAGNQSRPTGRRSRRALKNWRVRSRLLLLAIPTVTALVLGGIRVTSAVQSALAFQRAEQRAVLAADITQVAQRLETERDQTIYYIALGRQGRAAALSTPGVFAHMSPAEKNAARKAAAAQSKI